MDNPLEQPAPDDPIERVHAFAYDLAWGVAHGLWGTGLQVVNSKGNAFYKIISPSNVFDVSRRNQLVSKWGDNRSGVDMMFSFGYAIESPFCLSPKALGLLERPAIPPKIFISYRQAESSALASLIEARLNIAAPEAGVFIDKLLEGGDEWERRIKHEICNRDTFILVYGKTTHKSTMIPKEVNWAKKSGSRIVPVLHNGYTGKRNFPKKLKGIQWIMVEKESAEAYELAILKLLNTLGYPTLQSPRSPAIEAT